jgi:hypothetical protein
MLRTTATHGRHEMLVLNQTVGASGAPQFLQKLAAGTTTGAPHCAQNRARAIRESGMENEASIAQPNSFSAAKRYLANSLVT